MTTVFADSFYFYALINAREALHARAVAFAGSFRGKMVTTGWVMTELADGLARPGNRELFLQMHQELQTHSGVEIVPCTEVIYRKGIQLYGDRLDKEWTLTDCISFVVMRENAILEALTGDHHFEQAGFVALLK